VAALNRACAQARGEYLARMDADDVALPERLALQIAFLDAHPKVAAVGSRVHCIDRAGRALPPQPIVLEPARIKQHLDRGECVITHPTVMMRRRVFEAVGGYRACMADAEDFDLWLRFADTHDLANLDQPLLRYRRHATQTSLNRFRHMALCNLASRASARLRRRGLADPLDTVGSAAAIDEAAWQCLGVTPNERRAILARAYLTTIDNLDAAGAREQATRLAARMEDDLTVQPLTPNECCDLHLLRARMVWCNGGRARGALELARAVRASPRLLARPFKPWLKERAG
jgi:hypothetical protein